jgi:hypothetical protein
MSFKGTYQYVEADVNEEEEVVFIATLDERRAANPDTIVGVIVDFANQIDRVLVVGDDAYQMGKMPMKYPRSDTFKGVHPLSALEGFGAYDIEKKPDGTADMLMEFLNLKEK